jgi:hypothetical protein
LQGVDVVKLIGVNLVFRLNRVSTGTTVLDWTQSFQTTNPLADAQVDLRATDPTFQIGGSAGFSIADVVYGNATVAVSRTLVSGVDDPDVTGSVARLKGELLSIRITGADLFIGSGASLNEDSSDSGFGTGTLPAPNDPNAVGFAIEGGSLRLAIFTARREANAGTAYTLLSTPLSCTNRLFVSCPMICASVVLPKPGGPNSSTWSSASSRLRAAPMKISSCSRTLAWPT